MGRRLLAIGLIAGLVAGCSGGGGNPSPSPTPPVASTPGTSAVPSSPSASPSRTGPLTTGPNVRPGEKPPVYPSVAGKHSAAGALALAVYYFRAFDWGYATNDPSLVMRVSAPSCRACRSYLNGLADVTRTGAVLKGGRLVIPESSVMPTGSHAPKPEFVADVVITEGAIYTQSPNGDVRKAAPAVRNHHSLVYLVWQGSRWLVSEVTAK